MHPTTPTDQMETVLARLGEGGRTGDTRNGTRIDGGGIKRPKHGLPKKPTKADPDGT